MNRQQADYDLLGQVFLRVPYYSPEDYRDRDLHGLLQEPAFRNALWLASPAFYRELEKQAFRYAALDERKRTALLKYFNRMCFRPTPFGAFASFTLLGWGNGEPLRLATPGGAQLHLRPSREYQAARDALRGAGGQTPVTVNPLLYPLGGEYRYIYSDGSAGKFSFLLNSLPGAGINRQLVRWLGARAVTYLRARQFIADHSGCTPAEAAAYLDFLVREQALLSGDRPDLIEGPPGNPLADDQEAATWRKWQLIPFDDALSLPGATRDLDVVAPRLSSRDRPYFYAALERPLRSGGADPGDQARLGEAFRVLNLLAQPLRLPALEDFRQAFKSRFDREKVPLLLALDPDTGIGYGESPQESAAPPLLEAIAFPDEKTEPPPLAWNAVHQLLMKTWLRSSTRSGYEPLLLADPDLAPLEAQSSPEKMPPSLPVVYRRSGGKLWIESAGGVTATSLIGRFSVFSPEVHTLCREIAGREAAANPGVVFAELSQLSDPHVDNVNRRRPVYDHVIPLNGFSRARRQDQLPPSDLLLSVHGQELILESARLGKRVIPRLPTAYNYQHTELPVFRFLCDLQSQQLRADYILDLQRLLPGLNFYPRVEYGQVILCTAKWIFSAAELAQLLGKPHSLGKLHLFRQQHHIPALVTLGRGDQQLVFNLGEDREALFFLACLKAGEGISLREYLEPDGTVRSGPRVQAAQFIAFLVNHREVYPQRPLSETGPARKKRIYPPGSDWLFLKIYCTPRSSDQLLAGVIAPLMREYRTTLRSWFFIRFAEGGYHLRLRLQGEARRLARLLPVMERQLRAEKFGSLVKDYQADSYKRELERYQEGLIELAEECFAAGSDWALYALTDLETRFPGLEPELAIFPLVWLMAADFLQDPEAEQALYTATSEGFLAVLSKGKSLRVDLDKKYRALKSQLNGLLNRDFLTDFAAVPVTRHLLQTLRTLSLASRNRSAEKRQELIADLIHMQVNRVFRSRQLHYEAVVHYCLAKHGASFRLLSRTV